MTDEVEELFEESLKRRAFAAGYEAFKTGAANPYVAVTARQAWRDGYDAAKAEAK